MPAVRSTIGIYFVLSNGNSMPSLMVRLHIESFIIRADCLLDGGSVVLP